jgi:peptidoglycan/xylan/chitin deacetylase (PgdA/CDA1 family)
MELHAAGRALRCHAFAVLSGGLAVTLIACARGVESPGTDPTPSPSPVISDEQAEDALGVAQAFVQASAARDTAAMWALLAPEEQQKWAGQDQFAAFIQRKFGAAKIELDLGRLLAHTDGQSVEFPLSLEGEDVQHPLIGPPLVLTQSDESWAVYDAGPLGRSGPILGAPAPVRAELSVPILTYHHISPQFPDDGKYGETVTVDAFAQQVRWLAESGHTTISVAELFNAIYFDVPLPPKPVILVFDDSYADFYHHAFPLLRELGFRASVSAITGSMDKEGYLTWEQARELSRGGIEFLSHTVSHANLALIGPDETRAEITQSRRALEDNLGRPAQYFVYPYGEPFVEGTDDKRAAAIALLQEAGYRGALTTSSGAPYVALQRTDAPFLLRRIPVSGGERLERFVSTIEPTPSPSPAPSPTPTP